jgi:cation transport ATPase
MDSSWEIRHDSPGRLRLAHPALHRRVATCKSIERELMTVLGVTSSKASPMTGTLLVKYAPRRVSPAELLEILTASLESSFCPNDLDRANMHLPLCTLSIPVAAVATFAVPTYRRARHVLFDQRRLGVDVLDSLVFTGCLATLSVFPGALLCWSLEIGRELVRNTHDRSRRLLLEAFEKFPRHAWLARDGQEVRVAVDRIQPGDTVVCSQGDVVPDDGVVSIGTAVIDRHRLTGERTSDQKTVGDRVQASTEVRSGQIHITVETTGTETSSARIGLAINEASGHRLETQERGERMADQAVIPTLALGAIGFAAMGPAGAAAVLNTDFSTGIRIAAPMALLSCLTHCARNGILVKDGNALDAMTQIDTLLIETAAIPDHRRPELAPLIRGLADRGINNVMLISADPEDATRRLAEAVGVNRYFAEVPAHERGQFVDRLRQEGHVVCYLGRGGPDVSSASNAHLTIMFGKASSLATESAQVVLLDEGLDKLCLFRDIAAKLDRTVRRSWSMIVAPNIACIAGIFTMGFGIIVSEITNNVAALAAVANGLLPLEDSAKTGSPNRDRHQTRPPHGLDRKTLRTQTQTPLGRRDSRSH